MNSGLAHKRESSSRLTDSVPRLAVVGCGAIAERYHVPAIAQSAGLRSRAVLIDSDLRRADDLAGRFGIQRTSADVREIIDEVDGAILSVPHHLHYTLGMQLIEHGVHVLCEKPLAATADEALQMVERAKQSQVLLCVNQTRRLFPAYAEIQRLISSGAIGTLRRIEYLDGKRFHWPTASGFYFQQRHGRGVLLDKGIHGLDAICWWLGGKPDVVVSENDSYGGPESVARLELQCGECHIDVQLSWLVQLDNTYQIVGSQGSISGNVEQWDVFSLERAGKRQLRRLASGIQGYDEFGVRLVSDFARACVVGGQPLVPAVETIDALRLIDESYAAARRFDMPWCETWSNEHAT